MGSEMDKSSIESKAGALKLGKKLTDLELHATLGKRCSPVI